MKRGGFDDDNFYGAQFCARRFRSAATDWGSSIAVARLAFDAAVQRMKADDR